MLGATDRYSFWGIMAVVGAVLLFNGGSLIIRTLQRRPSHTPTVQLTGIVALASVGVLLVLAQPQPASLDGAFALLGTAIGYLATNLKATPVAGKRSKPADDPSDDD